MSKKRNINWLYELATNNNGKCLSDIYINNHSLVLWECSSGHKWEARPANVSNGTWCPYCAGKDKKDLNWLQELASKKNGTCLSVDYFGMNNKYLWECSIGHRWETAAGNIQQGTWCKICAGKDNKDLDWLQQLAMTRNGKCLSTKYTTSRAKYLWECSDGHKWETTANSVQQGHWCLECATTSRDLNWLYELASRKGGKCLSSKYINCMYKYTWECHKEHRWKTRSSDIQQGYWCPSCPSIVSKGHQSVLDFIKELDPNLEVKSNDRIQIKPLELDIWIPSKKLAIEFCGMYWHGEAHNGTKAAQKHFYKYKQCKAKGIRLLTVFESEWAHKPSIIKNLIKNILGYSNSIKINARNCNIKEITASEAKTILDSNHILGFTRGKYLGLFHETELVAVLGYKTEAGKINITRYCTDSKYQVRGGFGKLLSLLKQSNKEIFTFSDNRFSEGNLYSSLGFKIEKEVTPSYWYFKQQSKLIHKFNFRKARIRKAFPEVVFDEKDTEIQMAQKLKYDRIWDCGLTKWKTNDKISS